MSELIVEGSASSAVDRFFLFSRVGVNSHLTAFQSYLRYKTLHLPGNVSMERTYDIFEVMPDKTLLWRECISGHEAALARMRALAEGSIHGFVLIHLGTDTVVAVLEAKKTAAGSGTEDGEKAGGGGDPKLSLARLYLLWVMFRRVRVRDATKGSGCV